jgi:hypothetical protein
LSLIEERSHTTTQALGEWYERVLGRVGVIVDAVPYFGQSANSFENERVIDMYPNARFVSHPDSLRDQDIKES